MRGLILVALTVGTAHAGTVQIGDERWADEPVATGAYVWDEVASTFNGERFWFAWRDGWRHGVSVFLSRAEADGTMVPPAATEVVAASMEYDLLGVSIAVGESTVLVAWVVGQGPYTAYAALYDRDARRIAGPFALGEVELGDHEFAYSKPYTRAAAGHGGFLVAWGDHPNADRCDVAFVAELGLVGTPHAIGPNDPTTDRDNCRLGVVAPTTDGWLVGLDPTWNDNDDSGARPGEVVRLATDGAPIGVAEAVPYQTQIVSIAPPLALAADRDAALSAWRVDMAFDALWTATPFVTEYWPSIAAAWSDDAVFAAMVSPAVVSEYGRQELLVTRLTDDGVVTTASVLRAHERDGEGQYDDLAVHRTGDHWTLTWWELGLEPVSGGVMLQRLADDGTPLDAEPVVAIHRGNDQDLPVAAGGDAGWLVVWRDERDAFEYRTMYAARYDAGGVPIGPPFPIATNIDLDSVSVAWGDGGWLVVWQDWASTGDPSPVIARHVGAEGTLGEAVELGRARDGSVVPVVWDGTRFLTMYQPADQSGDTCLRLRVIDADGGPSGDVGYLGDQPDSVSLGCGAAGCLVAWSGSGSSAPRCGGAAEEALRAQVVGQDAWITLDGEPDGWTRVVDVAAGPDGWLVLSRRGGLQAHVVGRDGRVSEMLWIEVTVQDAEAIWTGDDWLIAAVDDGDGVGTEGGHRQALFRVDAAGTTVEEIAELSPADLGEWDGVTLAPGPRGKALVAYPRWDGRPEVAARRLALRVVDLGAVSDDPSTDAGCGCRAGTRAESPAAALLLLVALAPLGRRRR